MLAKNVYKKVILTDCTCMHARIHGQDETMLVLSIDDPGVSGLGDLRIQCGRKRRINIWVELQKKLLRLFELGSMDRGGTDKLAQEFFVKNLANVVGLLLDFE